MKNSTRALQLSGAIVASFALLGLTACGGQSLSDTGSGDAAGEVEFMAVPDEERPKM
ncbi:hypothetical protein [Leucobacter muris]|uniref:hypothetical protein n=1 Tax=Leucobacter muris TaxID=1935379 RepID=UPI001E45361D|nr:hypothetical protein [Leucobacter muris]